MSLIRLCLIPLKSKPYKNEACSGFKFTVCSSVPESSIWTDHSVLQDYKYNNLQAAATHITWMSNIALCCNRLSKTCPLGVHILLWHEAAKAAWSTL